MKIPLLANQPLLLKNTACDRSTNTHVQVQNRKKNAIEKGFVKWFTTLTDNDELGTPKIIT